MAIENYVMIVVNFFPSYYIPYFIYGFDCKLKAAYRIYYLMLSSTKFDAFLVNSIIICDHISNILLIKKCLNKNCQFWSNPKVITLSGF